MASLSDDRKMSFKEIMDEEYARKLQADFEEEAASYAEPSQEEKDFLLALELSRQTQCEAKEEPIDEEENQQLSKDFLIALQLQETLNEEQRDYQHILQQRNQGTNIHLATGYEPLFQTEETHNTNYDEEEEEEEDFDEYDEYESLVSQKAWTKPGGRIPSTDLPKQNETTEIITKHDPILCGSRNTRILETQIGIDCGNMIDDHVTLSNPVFNELNQHAVRSESRRIRKHGKEDRETRESVMDTQTRLLLYKLLNTNVLSEIGGIISSGKEANVYSATAGEGNSMYAIKIYKTTLNEFKNRDDYIKDDYRFRHRYNKQSSRKFIKVWAEKEVENLQRLRRYNIPCPEVILLKKNVLVMSFIGNGSTAAPQLKAISGLSVEKYGDLYIQCIKMMRIMFQQANLIHGDLSEYNLLYQKGKLWMIDVAQAVEHEHPNSLTFLRRDCENINKYFTRMGLQVMTTRELFNYITDVNITPGEEEENYYLTTILEHCQSRKQLSVEEMLQEKVFLDTHIPRHLSNISDPFQQDHMENEASSTIFQNFAKLKDPPKQ